MPTFWDLLPASLWPTQPFIPPVNPGQGTDWPPGPAASRQSMAPMPNFPPSDALASSASWDDDRYQQMLADAKRASEFVGWIFGPPDQAAPAPAMGTERQAPRSRDFLATPVVQDSFNVRRSQPFDRGSPIAPPVMRDVYSRLSQGNPNDTFRNPPVFPSDSNHGSQSAPSEMTGQAAAVEPFGGGYAPSAGEFLASRVNARDLLKRGGATYDLDNYQIVADGAAVAHRDADGNADGFTFTGPAYVFDPATGAFANVGGTPERPTSATLGLKTGALRIRR
jgi:hypothetical protein